MHFMKIELTPNKIVKDATTIWNAQGPAVDIVMDLKNLTFKENSIDMIYSFHVLDHLFLEEIPAVLNNWVKCLKPGGDLFLIVDDFEYVCRAFVGGDINIEQFNMEFCHSAQLDRDLLTKLLTQAGFKESKMVIWFDNIPNAFTKKHFDLVISGKKDEQIA